MEKRTKNRIYVAITLVALCALFFDRLVLNGSTNPAPATAAVAAQDVATRTGDLTPAALSIPELPFPRNLPHPSTGLLQRDIFAPPGVSASPDRSKQDGKSRKMSDAVTFTTRNRLEAVLSDTSGAIAVVNGKWVYIGQSFDGCTLTRINGATAIFHCGDSETVLNVVQDPQIP